MRLVLCARFPPYPLRRKAQKAHPLALCALSSQEGVEGAGKAALYEGVKANGARFVLPLTDVHAGREDRTESLREAIAEARHGWVMVESDAEQDSWITTAQTSEKF